MTDRFICEFIIIENHKGKDLSEGKIRRSEYNRLRIFRKSGLKSGLRRCHGELRESVLLQKDLKCLDSKRRP